MTIVCLGQLLKLASAGVRERERECRHTLKRASVPAKRAEALSPLSRVTMNLTAALSFVVYTPIYRRADGHTHAHMFIYTSLYSATFKSKNNCCTVGSGGVDPTVCMNEISYMIINQLSQPHELISAASHAVPLYRQYPPSYTHLNGILCIFQVTSRPYSRVDIAEFILQAT